MNAKTPRYLRERRPPSVEDARLRPREAIAWADRQIDLYGGRAFANSIREADWSADEAEACEAALNQARAIKLEAVLVVARRLLDACAAAEAAIVPGPASAGLLDQLHQAGELGAVLSGLP